MEMKAVSIQDLDDKGWQDYFRIGTHRLKESTAADGWLEFKKDRLDQYDKAPIEFKMEEYLLTYDGNPFGWIAHSPGGKYITFIFDTELEEIPDSILKDLLVWINKYTNDIGLASAFFWSKSSTTNVKMKSLGVELVDETEDNECQFILTKEFLENYII